MSTGIPSPSNLRSDSEIVCQWARSQVYDHLLIENKNMPIPQIKVGVHGISIGGLAASHLGRIGAVDFLFLDRTFRDLTSFPKGFHYSLPYFLTFITMWENPSVSEDYLLSNCYKVIAQDPNDEVIGDGISCKTGVSLKII